MNAIYAMALVLFFLIGITLAKKITDWINGGLR